MRQGRSHEAAAFQCQHIKVAVLQAISSARPYSTRSGLFAADPGTAEQPGSRQEGLKQILRIMRRTEAPAKEHKPPPENLAQVSELESAGGERSARRTPRFTRYSPEHEGPPSFYEARKALRSKVFGLPGNKRSPARRRTAAAQIWFAGDGAPARQPKRARVHSNLLGGESDLSLLRHRTLEGVLRYSKFLLAETAIGRNQPERDDRGMAICAGWAAGVASPAKPRLLAKDLSIAEREAKREEDGIADEIGWEPDNVQPCLMEHAHC